jgi:hypothetical protein
MAIRQIRNGIADFGQRGRRNSLSLYCVPWTHGEKLPPNKASTRTVVLKEAKQYEEKDGFAGPPICFAFPLPARIGIPTALSFFALHRRRLSFHPWTSCNCYNRHHSLGSISKPPSRREALPETPLSSPKALLNHVGHVCRNICACSNSFPLLRKYAMLVFIYCRRVLPNLRRHPRRVGLQSMWASAAINCLR